MSYVEEAKKAFFDERWNDGFVAARERIGEIRSLEDQFIVKLRNLKKHSVPQNVMLALACKVFNLHLTRDDVEKMSGAERKKRWRLSRRSKPTQRNTTASSGQMHTRR